MTLRNKFRQTAEIRVYQWAAVLVSLTVLWVGGIYGAATYSNNQRDASEASAAAAKYAGEYASFENARDERSRCLQRVEARSDLRGVFLGIFELIDTRSAGSDFTQQGRALLDSEYPTLDEANCPVQPTPPVPPAP
jgi:uncharacterized membrane protein